MYNLLLYNRLSANESYYRENITEWAQEWRRTIRALGGYWLGGFYISQDQLSRGQILELYHTIIGWRVVEAASGFTTSRRTWEGEIAQMVLTLDGRRYVRTLDTEHWMNKVAVAYPAGQTSWSEDTDSSDVYGESCYIDTVSMPIDETAAEARRDRRLLKYAFPRSWAQGGLNSNRGDSESGVSLDVTCAGYVFSMNRRYRETDTAEANLSAQITTLVGESEFVTAGSIETNTLQVPISAEGTPSRLWDLIEELIGMGDASGNEYVGGVYAGRQFNYEAAETSVTHHFERGRLYDLAGNEVEPADIRPNIVVQSAGAPWGWTPAGGRTVDRTNREYIEEVEFIAPDQFSLKPQPIAEL